MKKVLGAVAKVFFLIFSLAILGMMMTYTWGALTILFPNNVIQRLWGMVLFDIAAMAWALAFVFESRSIGQYAFAAIGFLTGFLGTILMVIADVILSGQTFVDTGMMGMYMVYGFIVATVIHAALVYAHHAASPVIHQQIEFGIAEGDVTGTAMKQATQYMDENKTEMARSITAKMLENSQRNLGLPIAVDPRIGFVPAAQQPAHKNEQTVVQQVELKEPPAPKPQHSSPAPLPEGYEPTYHPNPDKPKEEPGAGDAPFPG